MALSEKRGNQILLGLVAVFLVIGLLYAVYTPPWQAPDEPAHYNYVAQISEGGCCPVIATGDWDQAYLSYLTSNQFPPDADLDAIEYEDHQPPLYYLLATPIFLISRGDLLAVRLVSVVLASGTLIFAYLTAYQLFGGRRVYALAAAIFAAFVPQHMAMMASVNNDSLAELVLAALLYLAVCYVKGGKSDEQLGGIHPAWLGAIAGIGFLTKLTIYLPGVLAVAAAIIIRWRKEDRPLGWAIQQTAWAGGVAIALGALWWGRNLAVYGWPDFLAQAAHEGVVVGQPRTAAAITDKGPGAYVLDLFTITYHSFFGQFGWMGVPMPRRTYQLIGLFLAVTATGWGISGIRYKGRLVLLGDDLGGWAVAAAVLTGTLVNYGYYNITFLQLQGRYLFTALIPIAMLIVVGFIGWRFALAEMKWIPPKLGERLRWLPLLAVSWLPLLCVYALFRFVIPNLG